MQVTNSKYPSKEEMEEIWRTGQIGWLANFSKMSKNKSRYQVTYIPYIETELPEHAVSAIVWAKNSSKALDEVGYDLSNKLHKLQKDGILPKVCYRRTVKEIL